MITALLRAGRVLLLTAFVGGCGLLLASCFGCFVDVLDCVGGSFFNVV